MEVLDSARKRKSAFAAQLADQDAAMAQLQARLEAARVEGERLKARAEEAPEAPAAAAAHADGTSVAVVVSETPAVEAAARQLLARATQQHAQTGGNQRTRRPLGGGNQRHEVAHELSGEARGVTHLGRRRVRV